MTKSTGGPSSYYDFKEGWVTANDIIDSHSMDRWGAHSWHLANIFKAVWRWGSKEGTTQEYDARKIVYSALRLLMMITDKETVREYLTTLQKDPQFKD